MLLPFIYNASRYIFWLSIAEGYSYSLAGIHDATFEGLVVFVLFHLEIPFPFLASASSLDEISWRNATTLL